jgi:3-phosphoshikimate 1-carboxyvinyltransferase
VTQLPPNWNPATAALPPLPAPPRAVHVAAPLASAVPASAAAAANTTTIVLPGSKYLTLRYLLSAFLAAGTSWVRAPALAEDTAVLVTALRMLGGRLTWEAEPEPAARNDHSAPTWSLRVGGVDGRPRTPREALGMGNAGAVLRLLLGIGALLPKACFETDHPDSLGRRPNADLLAALRQLGLDVTAREPGGLLPITLHGGPPVGGAVSVSGARSSQYLSALLYLAPLLPRGLEIRVTEDLRSAPLVRATLAALAAAGIAVTAAPDLRAFSVPGDQRYAARDYTIPGDLPSAAALAASVLVLRRPVTLVGLAADDEGAPEVLAALTALGARSSASPAGRAPHAPAVSIAPRREKGRAAEMVRLDADAIIDSVPVLAAAACLRPGETRFERAGTLRLKESDRIGDLCAELSRAGADVTAEDDAIVVRGQPRGLAGGVTVAGHDDHRLVQALAIAALGSPAGLTITGADAVAKSYPGFFADLARLGARITVLEP